MLKAFPNITFVPNNENRQKYGFLWTKGICKLPKALVTHRSKKVKTHCSNIKTQQDSKKEKVPCKLLSPAILLHYVLKTFTIT